MKSIARRLISSGVSRKVSRVRFHVGDDSRAIVNIIFTNEYIQVPEKQPERGRSLEGIER